MTCTPGGGRVNWHLPCRKAAWQDRSKLKMCMLEYSGTYTEYRPQKKGSKGTDTRGLPAALFLRARS